MIKSCLAVIFLWLGWNVFIQQGPVLVRISGKDVLRSEFEYSYNRDKSLLAFKHATLGKYVEYFVNFKLKADDAEAAGLDTAFAFREEVGDYRARLVESYLTDTVEADAAAYRRYDRMKVRHRGGQVRMCRIFKYLPQNVSSDTLRDAVARMDSIHEYLRKNPRDNAFNACVERFSDDKRSLWVSWLQMPMEFENMAFELPVDGVSQPFFAPQGIHIIKIFERRELSPFEKVKDEIMARQSRYEADRGVEVQVEKLKKEYRYIPDKAGVDELTDLGHTSRTLFTLAGRSYTGTDFVRFAAAYPTGVREQLDAFVVKTVLDYENTCLEQKYPDLRCLVQNYKEQALLKKVIDKETRKRAATNEAGLKAYFEKHRSDCQWEERRYRGIVLHGVSKRVVKQARKFLKSLPEEEWKDTICLAFNVGAQPQIQTEQGAFASGDNAYVDDLVFKGKDTTPLVSFPFTVVLGKKVKEPDDYREVKDRLVADYQTYSDGCWVDRLRSSAKVEINQEVLRTVNNH